MKAFTSFLQLLSICAFVLLMQGCGGGGGGGGSAPGPGITNINGAIAGIGAAGSLFTVNGNNFGNLSAQAAGFSVDFRDAATNQAVASAQVDFASGNWANTLINGTVPNGLTPGTFYKVTVSTNRGTSNSVNFLIVPSVTFNPSTITWSQTSALPQGQQGFPTVIAPVFANFVSAPTNYIYTLGGNTSSGTLGNKTLNLTSVNLNKLDNSTGALSDANWTSTTPLPGNRGFAAGVLANGFNSQVSGNGTIYVLGGLDGTGTATSTVFFASVSSDGTIPSAGTAGTWATTTPLPQPLFAAEAMIFHGRIYVSGGNNAAGASIANVYFTQINSDGTLGNWQTLTNIPAPLAYHQMVAVGRFLYLLGGESVAVDPVTNSLNTPLDTIFFSQINLQDGTLSAWSINPSGMGSARDKFTAVVAGNALIATGGLYAGTPGSSESRIGTFNADGPLSTFNAVTGTNTISNTGHYDPYNHSTAFFVDIFGNPHILILGGADVTTGTLHTEVWYQH